MRKTNSQQYTDYYQKSARMGGEISWFVRNLIILVAFVEPLLKQGMPLAEAVVDAGKSAFAP